MKWSIKPELTPREKAEEERGKQARQVPKIVAPPPAIFAVAIIGGALVNRSYGWAFGGGFVDIDNDGWEDLHTPNGFVSGETMKDT